MATLSVGGSSGCGSLIQVPCLARLCKAEVRANDGSTAPRPGSLILCSHFSSWLPFTPHQRAPTFPYPPLPPLLAGAFTAFFSLFSLLSVSR